MEVLTTDKDSDDDSSKKSKSRRAEKLGAIIVEPKSKDSEVSDFRPSENGDHESFWRKLSGREDTAEGDERPDEGHGESEELSLVLPEIDAAADPEEFNDIDRRFAETELARAHRQAIEAEFSVASEESEDAGSIEAELMALEAFYDGIIKDHMPLEEAFSEAMDGMGVAPETGEQQYDMVGPEEIIQGRHDAYDRLWVADDEESPVATDQEAVEQMDDGASAPGGSGHGAGSVPPQPPSYNVGGNSIPQPPQQPPVRRPVPVPASSGREAREPRYTRSNVIGAALVGGIVGYLIGRRRGRIKTEKKLLPVQKKLEKDVAALEGDIFKKEAALRKVAREQQYQQKNADRLKRQTARKEQQLAAETSAEQPAVMTRHALERVHTQALEANQLHGKKAPERIGKVLISAEHPSSELAKKAEAKKQAGRHSETMSRRELMEISDKIAVNNTNLRRIYETHLVGEQGLRRLVEAHLRGGDISRVLQQEMLEHQIDFERDPVMRDHRPEQDVATRNSGSALDKLLSQSGLADRGQHEEQAVMQARAAHQATEEQKSQQRQRAVDVALVGTVLVLVAVIALLLIR